MKNKNTQKIIIIFLFIAIGIASRILPHPWNFTPLAAIALVISSYFGWKYSVLAISAIMLFSDALIGTYHIEIMLSVYGSFMLSALIGRMIDRKKPSSVLFGSLGASLSFFFITNWAVWQFGTMYSHNLPGLIEAYVMAIPFFKNSLLGDLIYTGAFFAAFEALHILAQNKKEHIISA